MLADCPSVYGFNVSASCVLPHYYFAGTPWIGMGVSINLFVFYEFLLFLVLRRGKVFDYMTKAKYVEVPCLWETSCPLRTVH